MQFGEIFTANMCRLFFYELIVFLPALGVFYAVFKTSFTRNQKCLSYLLSLAVVSLIFTFISNNILDSNESNNYTFIVILFVAFIVTLFLLFIVKKLSADSSKLKG